MLRCFCVILCTSFFMGLFGCHTNHEEVVVTKKNSVVPEALVKTKRYKTKKKSCMKVWTQRGKGQSLEFFYRNHCGKAMNCRAFHYYRCNRNNILRGRTFRLGWLGVDKVKVYSAILRDCKHSFLLAKSRVLCD